MLKNKKKLLILIPLLTLLVFCTFKYGKTLAKYVSNSAWSYYLKTKEFYFSSDYLDINEKTNVNKLWDGTSVHFNIKNSINQNLITGYDIAYDVTCEVLGDAASHTRCTLNGENDENWSGTLSSSTSCVNNTGDNVDVSSYTDEQCTTGGYTIVNDEFIKDAYFDVILTDQYYTMSDITVKITAESTNPYNKIIIGNFNLKKVDNDTGTIIQEYKNYSNYDLLILSNSYSTSKCANLVWDPTYVTLLDDKNSFNTFNNDLNGNVNNIELDITAKNNVSIKFKSVNKNDTVDITKFAINEDCGKYSSIKKVNKPQLVSGMTPVKWNGTTWIDTTASDLDWYDYDTKNWANARTADGSMWVWIPRYIYKISTNWHTNTAGTVDVLFSKALNDNWNSAVIGNIDTGTTSDASNNKWTNHPAFTFGSTELYGIWVAKFEATAVEGVVNPYTTNGVCATTDDNVLTKTIKVSPNVTSWRCLSISNAFTNVRNMETNATYGWITASGLQSNGTFTTDTNGLDTHMMKNSELGAVAYLSKSIYGKNTEEVYVNNSQTFTTGCAGNTATAGAYNGCQNVYNSTTGVKASTTGTIYGVYDLSGGAWEYQSAYVNNGSTGQGASVRNAITKYKDIYPITTDTAALNYASAINLKGEAIYETSSTSSGSTSWFGDYSGMPTGGNSYFIRGGRFANGASSGVYASGGSWAGPNTTNGFRPVLVAGDGL